MPSRSNLPGSRGARPLARGLHRRAGRRRDVARVVQDRRRVASCRRPQAVISSSRFPGGSGWQSLPAWLPQEHAVWDVNLDWALAPPAVIAPVAPLR